MECPHNSLEISLPISPVSQLSAIPGLGLAGPVKAIPEATNGLRFTYVVHHNSIIHRSSVSWGWKAGSAGQEELPRT